MILPILSQDLFVIGFSIIKLTVKKDAMVELPSQRETDLIVKGSKKINICLRRPMSSRPRSRRENDQRDSMTLLKIRSVLELQTRTSEIME